MNRSADSPSGMASFPQNGDFLSLLPRSPLAQLPSLSPERPGELHGTTVFAFHCAEGVIVAGDHRATAGNVVFSDKTEKILELDAHSLLAVAGSPAFAFEMGRMLQTTFEFYRRSQLQPLSLAAKVRALTRLLRENLPATLQGVGAVAPLFVGAEAAQPGKKPGIYFYDPFGAQFEATEFAASGSGAGAIKSILHYLTEWGDEEKPGTLSLKKAVVLANRLLMTASEFDTATGGINPPSGSFATLLLLTPEGVRPVAAREQESMWMRSERGGRDD
ncbi:MAG: hypothetical protein WD490_02195 [Opitutales bacterium]